MVFLISGKEQAFCTAAYSQAERGATSVNIHQLMPFLLLAVPIPAG